MLVLMSQFLLMRRVNINTSPRQSIVSSENSRSPSKNGFLRVRLSCAFVVCVYLVFSFGYLYAYHYAIVKTSLVEAALFLL